MSNLPQSRIVALTITGIVAIMLAVFSWRVFAALIVTIANRIDDKNAIAGLAFICLATILLGAVHLVVTVEWVEPAATAATDWLARRHQLRQAQRLQRAKRDETERIAADFAAKNSAKVYMETVLDTARARAAVDQQAWRHTARDQMQPALALDPSLGIFTRYATASAYHKMLIREGYQALMDAAHPKHIYHAPVAIAALPPLARLLFLPVAIDATDGPSNYDILDLDASDHAARRYVYRSSRVVPDATHWERNIPAIESYLSGRWRVTRGSGATIVLTGLPSIPERFHLPSDALLPGMIYLGHDLNTGKPVHVGLDRLSHTLVAGPTGMGKSVLLHQLMASVVANADRFDKVYLLDLKYGLELQPYAKLGAKFELIDASDRVPDLIRTLVAEMDRRGALLRQSGKTDWQGPLILIVIDEFADMLLGQPDKKTREAIETNLVRLTNLSRALGFRFWVQSQKTTADSLPAAIRNNLQSIISFRMTTNQAAAMLFGGTEQFPADIINLRPGQFIYRDGRTSETLAAQAALVTPEDVRDLARVADVAPA